MKPAQREGLISLLQDESEAVRNQIHRHVLRLGAEGEQILSEALQHRDEVIVRRARAILRDLRRRTAWDSLLEQTRSPEIDLFDFHATFSRIEDPDCDVEGMRSTIEELSRETRARVAKAESAEETAQVLAKVLHEEAGFHGATGEYYLPANSYLSYVLKERQGIPISLATVYILAGRGAGLALSGVGMPHHFLVRLEGENESVLLDPFRGGRITTREDCRIMLAGFQRVFRAEYLRSVTDRELTLRALANLVRLHQATEDEARLSRCMTLIERLQVRNLA